MKPYVLNKVFDSYTDFTNSEIIGFNISNIFLNQHMEFCKPDFVALMSINSAEPKLYEHNFNLDFETSQEGSLQEIIDAADQDQGEKILEIDIKSMEFIGFNMLSEVSILFQLRFTATLQEGNPRTFLREISLVKDKISISSEAILLVAIYDVTEMVGIKKHAFLDIKYISTAKNPKKDKLATKIAAFKKKANNLLQGQVKLTKREKEILEFISKGNTSDEIAQKLFISVATVNTHRQNLIKKFKVKNTSALIHMV